MGNDMTTTEYLRTMLDKRGVDWDALPDKQEGEFLITATRWHDREGNLLTMCIDEPSGNTWDFFWTPTPEQAIEATLWRGTCKLDGYTDAAFSVVQAAGDTDFVDYAEVCECSACGASVIVPHECERVTAGSDELWPKFNYCPSCGRRCVG